MQGAITVGLFGGVAFLLVWNVTRRYVVLLLGQLIGFSVTLTFKILILFVLRRLIVSAFYRRQPLANNIVSLILEVWNVGITLGYMLVRTVKLLAITVFYIGRIGKPPVDYTVSMRTDHGAYSHPCAQPTKIRLYLLPGLGRSDPSVSQNRFHWWSI